MAPIRIQIRSIPIAVEIKTNSAFSFFLRKAKRPVMKAEIPVTITAIIVSAKTVRPSGHDEPMINNISMAVMSQTDHVPGSVPGIIVQGCFAIISSATLIPLVGIYAD